MNSTVTACFPLLINYLQKEGIVSGSVSVSPSTVTGTFYDKLDQLMTRSVFLSEAKWFSEMMESLMTLLLDSGETYTAKSLQILKHIVKGNPDFVPFYWEQIHGS